MLKRGIAVALMGLFAGAALAGTVTVTLDSAVTDVAPGGDVPWSLYVEVSSGDNLGLALISVDLIQDGGNPATFDIAPADAGTIPAAMNGFDRPGGITNPGEGGAASGYIGVQRGTAGALNLIQVGGAQNSFGQPGSEFGTDADVDGGIGQSGAQLVVSGTIIAPATEGTYTVNATNVVANVLETIGGTGEHSTVSAADIVTTDASITFTVGQLYDPGDMNCDGVVSPADIDPFVIALVQGQAAYEAQFPNCVYLNADLNNDGLVSSADIDPFVTALTGGK
jgi:hypothetical protein